MVHHSRYLRTFTLFEANGTDKVIVPYISLPLTGVSGVVPLRYDGDVLLNHSDASALGIVSYWWRLRGWGVDRVTIME